MSVKIVTNYHYRELQYYYMLAESDQRIIKDQYDYLDDSELDEMQFVKYRNNWYALCDFMSLHNKVYCPNPPEFMSGWDGYLSDSFFSGILIKFSECGEAVILATYY